MIVPPSPLRFLMLIRTHGIVLVCGGAVASLIAAFIGLSEPYTYRSEATLKFSRYLSQSTARASPTARESIEILVGRSVPLTRSPEVLGKVAQELANDGKSSLRVLAPDTMGGFSLIDRFLLLRAALSGIPASSIGPHIPVQALSPESLTERLDQNLTFQADIELETLRISYEAGDPEVAQRVCRRISEGYISVALELEKEELRRQEAHLDSAIKLQLESIEDVEGKMRKILEQYPQILASKNDPNGSLVEAQRFVEKRDRLRRVEAELHANHSFLDAIEQNRSLSQTPDRKLSGLLLESVADEISVLELQLFKDTRLAGYDEENSEIKAMREKISSLTTLFNSFNTDGEEATAHLNDSLRRHVELRDTNRRLATEAKTLAKQLKTQNNVFKDILKENYSFESHLRELSAQEALKNDLYRELQKTRVILGSIIPMVAVFAPATLELYPINVSVRKRTIFGFFVGFAMVLSVLWLLDLIYPLLLSLEDLSLLHIKHFGQFRKQESYASQIAHCLLSLRHKEDAPSPTDREGGVAVFWPISVDPALFDGLLNQLVTELTKHGRKVGVLSVGTPNELPEAAINSPLLGSVEAVRLTIDSIPSHFASAVIELRTQCDWVLFSGAAPGSNSMDSLVSRNADYFFFVSEIGRSELKELKRLTENAASPETLQHYALTF